MDSTLIVRMDREAKKALQEYASRHHTSASEIVRQLIMASIMPDEPYLLSSRLARAE